jgi:hypothetical protein
MAMDLDTIRARTDTWGVRASAAWAGDEPDLGRLLDDWTDGLSHEQAAQFAERAEKVYDDWRLQARTLLTDALTNVYREVISEG